MFSRTERLGTMLLGFSILGSQNPIRSRIASRQVRERMGLAVDHERALFDAGKAETQAGGFGAPGPEQSGQAEDLALLDLETHRVGKGPCR